MMGEAKRRRQYAVDLVAQGIHSMSGYDVKPDMPVLMRRILEVLHAEADTRENGMIPASEIEAALLFHLCQVLRSVPTHYKDKAVNECIETIREAAYIPFKDGERVVLGDEVGDA